MYRIKFHNSASGTIDAVDIYETEEEAREGAGNFLKKTPNFGMLTLSHVVYKCRECDTPCETEDDAYLCCHPDYQYLKEECEFSD